MTQWSEMLACLPQPPDFRYDWEGLRTIVPFLEPMKSVPQNPAWHGEGDVMTHTKMVCEALAALPEFRQLGEEDRMVTALAALLHDVGKIRCTRLEDGVYVSPHHGATGAQMARTWLWTEAGLSGNAALRESVCLLIRYHTLPLHLLEDSHSERRGRKVASNGALAPWFTWRNLCLLAEADVRGRISPDTGEKLEAIGLCRELTKEAGCFDGPYAFASECTARAYLSGRKVWPDQPLYDDSWGEVILLCGLPGTGKDTWIRNHCASMPVVCLDDIRRQMKVKPGENQGRVVQEAKEQARALLREKKPFVWNATSLTAQLRQNQISLFEEYGARVRIVYLETGWQENLRRNADRQHVVPENVMCDMLEKLVPPERFEARSVEWIMV